MLHWGRGTGTQPKPPRAPITHLCAPRPGEHGARSWPITASRQGKEAAPSAFCPPSLPRAVLLPGRGQWGKSPMPPTWVPRGWLGVGGARDCSRFILEEMRAEAGLRTAAAIKDKEKPFHVQECRCRAVAFLAQLLPAWGGGGHVFGARAVGGGGSSPARALPVFPAVIQEVLSAPARRDLGTFLCETEKDPCAGGKRSLLRPCCDPGAVARDAVGRTGGRYSRRCPASLGARLDQGLQAPPWHPLKEKRCGDRLKDAPPEGVRPSASCREARVLTGDPGTPAEPLSPWEKGRRLSKGVCHPAEPGPAAPGAQDPMSPIRLPKMEQDAGSPSTAARSGWGQR